MKKLFIIITLFFSLSTFAAEEVLPVIAHWSFDHDSGTILKDSGPNKLDAELKSADKMAMVETDIGIQGKALKLSKTPSVKYLIQDKKGVLNLQPPFSIAMWMKRIGDKPKSMCLINKMTDGNKQTGWDFRYDWKMIDLRFGDGQKRQSAYSPKYQIRNDKWYHVAATNDGKIVRLFINCEMVKERIFENATPVPNKLSAIIGNYNGQSDVYNFIGFIDELYIVGKVLSGEELFKLSAPPN